MLSVRLREPQPSDVTSIVTAMRAYGASVEPWIEPLASIGAARTYVARRRDPSNVPRLILRDSDRALMGTININGIQLGGLRSASIGYAIFGPYQGRGYGTLALALTLDHAFDTLRLNRVEINVQPLNAASAGLAKKLGFRFEGHSPRYLFVGSEWCDHDRYALLSTEWAANRDRFFGVP